MEDSDPKALGGKSTKSDRILKGGKLKWTAVLCLVIVLLPQAAVGMTNYYADVRVDTMDMLERMEKEHGILAEEAYSVAGSMGSGCVPTKIDFSPVVAGKALRAHLADVFADLNGQGETLEETERLTSRREILEDVIKRQERWFEAKLNSALSRSFGSKVASRPAHFSASLTIGNELPPSQTDFPSLIRQEIKKDAEKKNSTKMDDIYLGESLFEKISNYQDALMRRIKAILQELSEGTVPQELFSTEEDIGKVVSGVRFTSYYEKSIYKRAPFDTLSLMTARSLARPSKFEALTQICFELYTTDSHQMLYKVDTEPKLKDNYYIQSVLPEFIAVADSDKDFKMVSTVAESDKNFIVDGFFCGKLYLLEKDCNVHERTGCKHILTPKTMYETKPRNKSPKVLRKNMEVSEDNRDEL